MDCFKDAFRTSGTPRPPARAARLGAHTLACARAATLPPPPPRAEGWDHGIYATSGERLLNMVLCHKGQTREGHYDSAPRLPLNPGRGDFVDYLVQARRPAPPPALHGRPSPPPRAARLPCMAGLRHGPPQRAAHAAASRNAGRQGERARPCVHARCGAARPTAHAHQVRPCTLAAARPHALAARAARLPYRVAGARRSMSAARGLPSPRDEQPPPPAAAARAPPAVCCALPRAKSSWCSLRGGPPSPRCSGRASRIPPTSGTLPGHARWLGRAGAWLVAARQHAAC